VASREKITVAHPSPEAQIQGRLTVSLVQLITEARSIQHGLERGGPAWETWGQVCTWLEEKLPPGTGVVAEEPVVTTRDGQGQA